MWNQPTDKLHALIISEGNSRRIPCRQLLCDRLSLPALVAGLPELCLLPQGVYRCLFAHFRTREFRRLLLQRPCLESAPAQSHPVVYSGYLYHPHLQWNTDIYCLCNDCPLCHHQCFCPLLWHLSETAEILVCEFVCYLKFFMVISFIHSFIHSY